MRNHGKCYGKALFSEKISRASCLGPSPAETRGLNLKGMRRSGDVRKESGNDQPIEVAANGSLEKMSMWSFD